MAQHGTPPPVRGPDRIARALPPNPDDPRPVIDVLVQGRTSVDLTFLGLDGLPRLGEEYYSTGFAMNPGASFINVASLARLGLRAAIATDLGNDFFSRYVLEQLRAFGIDERFIRMQDRDLAEVSVGLSYPHDRTFITWDAARDWESRRVQVADLLEYRVRCLFTHLAFDDAVFAESRRQGVAICADSSWNPTFLTSPEVWRVIDQADVFMPNLLEARTITGAATAEEALDRLMGRVPMLAIKLGPYGALGAYRGDVYRVPALPVTAVDTTGAGDNFDAGFIYGLLHDLPFEHCLRCAVVSGSLSTTVPGGVVGSPDQPALLRGLERLGRLIVDAAIGGETA